MLCTYIDNRKWMTETRIIILQSVIQIIIKFSIFFLVYILWSSSSKSSLSRFKPCPHKKRIQIRTHIQTTWLKWWGVWIEKNQDSFNDVGHDDHQDVQLIRCSDCDGLSLWIFKPVRCLDVQQGIHSSSENGSEQENDYKTDPEWNSKPSRAVKWV